MSFALLALICGVAMLGPIISVNRLAPLPVVIGELAVGVVLGRTGLNVLNPDDATLTFMAQIGFALVMFVAGSHVPVRTPALRGGLRTGILRAIGVGILAVPLGLVVGQLFGTGHGPLYAVLIASSSAGVVMPLLGTTSVTSAPGVQFLVQLAVADAACIIALPLVLDPANALRAAIGAVVILLVAGVFFVVLSWAERTGRRRRLHDLSEERGLAMELRVTLTLLFVLAAIAATMHISVMLAGFAMGLAVAAVGEPRRLANQTFALTEGFFAPIFFVWLGSSLDLRILVSSPDAIWLGVAVGAAAVLAHGLLAFTRQPLPLAVSTSAQLGVPVAAAALGRSTGLLGGGEATALLLGAVVTIAVVTGLSKRTIDLVQTAGATA